MSDFEIVIEKIHVVKNTLNIKPPAPLQYNVDRHRDLFDKLLNVKFFLLRGKRVEGALKSSN